MAAGSVAVSVQCLSFREYFSASNMKSIVRGFIYEYETPKIVTIHSISIALMCRTIQVLILIYGIAYLMIHKKGYQEMDTSIISSITLKVKGIGYNQTADNQTLVIDGADYIVPPQENNALFLMTNFIRTDQEHKRCAEAPDVKESACVADESCRSNRDLQKANGKWTGRCLKKNNSRSGIGLCEMEGWCPVENDRDMPLPIRDALKFTIFVKNFIEFPRFKVIRKNIQANASYLKGCQYHPISHKTCPIFRIDTLMDIVEENKSEQNEMLKFGGVIRMKIDWKCNLDKPLNQCLPEYSFGRLDAPYKEASFSHGFNFRFASHWKHQNRSFRTLTKAFGLRFIISVSGHAGRFDLITLSLNIGSLIGILGLATFICDIVALYVHRQSDVYRQQKFQDVDLNLLRLETLNNLAVDMMSEESKRKNGNHLEPSISTDQTFDGHDGHPLIENRQKSQLRRLKVDYEESFDKLILAASAAQSDLVDTENSTSSLTQRRVPSTITRQAHATDALDLGNDKLSSLDRMNVVFIGEVAPKPTGTERSNGIANNQLHKTNSSITNDHEQASRPGAKLETFL